MQRLKTTWIDFRDWRKRTKKIRRRISWTVIAVFMIWYAQCLPEKLFTNPTSTVLLDRNGELLGARIASDGQWRFPEAKTVPPKVAVCIVEFEDRNFYTHIGISAKGIVRAVVQNAKSDRIVSGGSTITMQLARMMRKNPPRTYSEKVLEMILATRMECRYSKNEILALYVSHAPFGNNVVGLQAASWRYFGRGAGQLSWAESATLAVLPNAPGLIYPGKNHTLLLQKRNRLLKRLYAAGKLDETTYELALSEPLPEKPLPLPHAAPHLLDQLLKEGHRGELIRTTIDRSLQEKAANQLQLHHRILRDNRIMNGAVMITDVNTGEILAYVGNTQNDAFLSEQETTEHAKDVNCIVAARSTGSILKPLLYAKCLETGQLAPEMLVTDIPSQFGSFAPKNYTDKFDGAVPANRALSRSLNIPMVHLLSEYGVTKFRDDLRRYGLQTIDKRAEHYGLSLILGGAEARLCDLNRTYAQMAQELKFGQRKPVGYRKDMYEKIESAQVPLTDRGCIYATFDAMVEVNRPDEDNNWKIFSSSQKIAWKTGTSFGFRDGWAIGITPDYVVSVWIGNADGEGRPGLTGVKAAAPLLFDVFRQLPKSDRWFAQPRSEMANVKICRESGHRATALCEGAVRKWIPKKSLSSPACPYHKTVHLDKSGAFRVDSECESVYDMRHTTWFVLPPVIERYYKINHPEYRPLPEYKPACLAKISDRALHLVYPKPGSQIYIPIEMDGKPGKTIFEAGHRSNSVKIYWHLDDYYIGETKEIHQLAVNPPAGPHRLTLIDEHGVSTTVEFEVLGK
jgi:penicillin-binding protein 1C